MQKKIKFRLFFLLLYFLSISLGIVIVLSSLNDNISFFYPPSKITEIKISNEIRLGGRVKVGSIVMLSEKKVEFIIADKTAEQKVIYYGILPLLFSENQSIIVAGKIKNGIFYSKEILIKHDEYYYPNKKTY